MDVPRFCRLCGHWVEGTPRAPLRCGHGPACATSLAPHHQLLMDDYSLMEVLRISHSPDAVLVHLRKLDPAATAFRPLAAAYSVAAVITRGTVSLPTVTAEAFTCFDGRVRAVEGFGDIADLVAGRSCGDPAVDARVAQQLLGWPIPRHTARGRSALFPLCVPLAVVYLRHAAIAGHVRAQYVLSEFLSQSSRTIDEARVWLERSVQRDGASLAMLGQWHWRTGGYRAALELFEQHLAVFGHDAPMCNTVALLCVTDAYGTGNAARALELAQWALAHGGLEERAAPAAGGAAEAGAPDVDEWDDRATDALFVSNMALYYEHGVACTPDMARAVNLHRLAVTGRRSVLSKVWLAAYDGAAAALGRGCQFPPLTRSGHGRLFHMALDVDTRLFFPYLDHYRFLVKPVLQRQKERVAAPAPVAGAALSRGSVTSLLFLTVVHAFGLLTVPQSVPTAAEMARAAAVAAGAGQQAQADGHSECGGADRWDAYFVSRRRLLGAVGIPFPVADIVVAFELSMLQATPPHELLLRWTG